MSLLALSDSFEYLCYGSTTIEIFLLLQCRIVRIWRLKTITALSWWFFIFQSFKDGNTFPIPSFKWQKNSLSTVSALKVKGFTFHCGDYFGVKKVCFFKKLIQHKFAMTQKEGFTFLLVLPGDVFLSFVLMVCERRWRWTGKVTRVLLDSPPRSMWMAEHCLLPLSRAVTAPVKVTPYSLWASSACSFLSSLDCGTRPWNAHLQLWSDLLSIWTDWRSCFYVNIL